MCNLRTVSKQRKMQRHALRNGQGRGDETTTAVVPSDTIPGFEPNGESGDGAGAHIALDVVMSSEVQLNGV
jgi:hypothetical protein